MCFRMNEVSTFSLFSPVIFYDFSPFRLLGFLCLSPSRFFRFRDLLGSNSGASGSYLVPWLRFVALLGSPLVPFGFLWFPLAPFWLRLAPFWFLLVPLGPRWFPSDPLWLPFDSLWFVLGSRWFPLGLAPFWFPLAPFGFFWFPLGFPFVHFWLTRGSVLLPWGPFCLSLAPRRLPGAESCHKQLVE